MGLDVVILAAGKGTRMRSELPKVLHLLAGKPLIQHVIDNAKQLEPDQIHVVVGHGHEQLRALLADQNLNFILQAEQLGTGHAVSQALPDITPGSTVLVLYGDVPLTPVVTMETLVREAKDRAVDEGSDGYVAVLTAKLANPEGYGRILRDSAGELIGVAEQKDASVEQLAIDEVNTGVLAAPESLLRAYLPQVSNNNAQGEFYLPDIIPLSVAEDRRVASATAEVEMDIQGINNKLQLAAVERELQLRQAQQLMLDGVSLADPGRIDIRGSVRCGKDVRIDVNTVFEGEVTLGDNVAIGANCVLKNVSVAANTEIHPFSHLEDTDVGTNCNVGPYARLRPGTVLADGVRIGNFVETKKSTIGLGSKVNHLSYIGDATLGDGVNIGAGTITCNYDGANKFPTEIGDKVFVGSNSTLVAPLQLEVGSFVAAGSTVTKKVEAEELAVSRAKQRNISGWQRPVKNNGKAE